MTCRLQSHQPLPLINYPYPKNRTQLVKWIDEAFEAREDEEKRKSIKNGRRKLKRNLSLTQLGGRQAVKPPSDGSFSATDTASIAAGAVVGASRKAVPRKPYLFC